MENIIRKLARELIGVDLSTIVKKIEEHTEDNEIYDAWAVVSKEILNDKKLELAFKSLKDVHLFHGHLTSGLKEARQELIDVAQKKLKSKLSIEEYEQVNMAF